jgi:L-fuconolactonase
MVESDLGEVHRKLKEVSRRTLLAGAIPLVASEAVPAQQDFIIDTHVHLFAADPARFPYSPLSYTPKPAPVEQYVQFVAKTDIKHAVIVHPEPYQDDHRYLEYCFAHEPSKGFFKGTCLFDPIDPATPARMKALMKRNPGRIVALRIHETHKPGTPSATTGAIRDRSLKDPQMLQTWRAAHELGIGIQMHFIPFYAPGIGELAAKFPEMPVILDHLARAGQGTLAEYENVLKLADLPRVYMKFSNVEAVSKEKFPYADVKPIVRQAYQAFGADRMIWGYLGTTAAEFEVSEKVFDTMFDFAPKSERRKIRGLTAQKLFAFS